MADMKLELEDSMFGARLWLSCPHCPGWEMELCEGGDYVETVGALVSYREHHYRNDNHPTAGG